MIAKAGAGAPLVARPQRVDRRTLLAMAARDRPAWAEVAIRTARAAFPRAPLLLHLDPLSSAFTPVHAQRAGVEWLRVLQMRPDLPPRSRVWRMRADAVKAARACGFMRVVFLDADIRVDPGAAAELERLWALRPHRHSAVSLTRYAGYDGPGYARAGQPTLERALLRTHGLGMALAFETSPSLESVAAALSERGAGSWDSELCTHVARGEVVTPLESWAVHLGHSRSLVTTRAKPLQVAYPTAALQAGA